MFSMVSIFIKEMGRCNFYHTIPYNDKWIEKYPYYYIGTRSYLPLQYFLISLQYKPDI